MAVLTRGIGRQVLSERRELANTRTNNGYGIVVQGANKCIPRHIGHRLVWGVE
jgi:hypothetical protein